MGAYPEIQPEGSSDVNPVMHAIGALMKEGGLVLHGEQEFVYHRPVLVGDELTSQGTIKDIYAKEGSSGTMTFVVTETDWLDESGDKVITAIMTLIHRA
jgi:acyl dehydratase